MIDVLNFIRAAHYSFFMSKGKGSLKSKLLFISDFSIIFRQRERAKYHFDIARFFPIHNERDDVAGTAKGHYFHQDLLVARRIFINCPERHIDIGSRIDGFAAHVASYREIEVFDIRELSDEIPNIKFTRADLEDLDQSFINCCDSLSSLHAIEHFGLGRYGDRVDFEGYVSGLKKMEQILRRRGKFYLSFPMGPQRIEFNAHRVFALGHILELLEQQFVLDFFSFIDDSGDLHENVVLQEDDIACNCNCWYGCAVLEMTKK